MTTRAAQTSAHAPSARALRAARTLCGEDGRHIYIPNTGWCEENEIAEIIDRETHAGELLEPLERERGIVTTEEQVKSDLEKWNATRRMLRDAIAVLDSLGSQDGEGTTRVQVQERMRKGCANCAEPAIYRYTFLLENFRQNPASSAYRRDDCSRCCDMEIFACGDEACKPKTPEGHDRGYSKHTLGTGNRHMFLEWVEVKP